MLEPDLDTLFYYVECPNCGFEFAVMRNLKKVEWKNQPRGVGSAFAVPENHEVVSIFCPQCGNKLSSTVADFPLVKLSQASTKESSDVSTNQSSQHRTPDEINVTGQGKGVGNSVNRCRECGQDMVRLINLKSYENYLLCRNLFQSLLKDFRSDGTQIYCATSDDDKKPLRKFSPESCLFCNAGLLKLAVMTEPFQLLFVCPSALGRIQEDSQTEKEGTANKIFCNTNAK